MGARVAGEDEDKFRGCATSIAISRTAACRPTRLSTAIPRRVWALSPQSIDKTLYDAFGQRQVSTMYTSLNQYHVVMEVAPQFQQNPSALQSLYVRSASGRQVPLSAFAHYQQPQRRRCR